MPADRRDPIRHGRRRAAVLATLLLGWQAGVLAGPAGADGDRFIHVVDPGDTLIGLADRYLGDPRKWTALQQINQVADPAGCRRGCAYGYRSAGFRRDPPTYG